MAGAEPGLKEARAEEGEEAWRLPVEDSPWAAQRLADRQRAAEALGARGQRLQAAAGSYAAALGALGAAQQAFAQALGEFCEEEGGEDGAIADLRRALPLDALLAPFANVADCQSLLRSQVNLLLCHSLFHLVTEDTGRAAEQQRKVERGRADYLAARRRYLGLQKDSKPEVIAGHRDQVAAARAAYDDRRFEHTQLLARIHLRKKYEFLEAVAGTVDAHVRFFRQGSEAFAGLEPHVHRTLALADERKGEEKAALGRLADDVRRYKEALAAAGASEGAGDDLSPSLGPVQMSALQSERAQEIGAAMRRIASQKTVTFAEESQVLHRGYLLKRSTNMIGDWKRRYFVLDSNGTLQYHRGSGKGGAQSTVDLHTATIKLDAEEPGLRLCFRVVSPQKVYTLQAETEAERAEWMGAIQGVIASLLNNLHNVPARTHSGSPGPDRPRGGARDAGHRRSLSAGDAGRLQQSVMETLALDVDDHLLAIRGGPGNNQCADCSTRMPDWASMNLCACLCIECSGIHRRLGVHVTKVRSLTLDVKVWEPSVVELFTDLGNDFVNSLWEGRLLAREAQEDADIWGADGGDDDDGFGGAAPSPVVAARRRTIYGTDISGFRKPQARDTLETKERYITAKYVDRLFVHKSLLVDAPDAQRLLWRACGAGDARGAMRALLAGADVDGPCPAGDGAATELQEGFARKAQTAAEAVAGGPVSPVAAAAPGSGAGVAAAHLAVAAAHLPLVDLLSFWGADLEARDTYGRTALHYSALNGWDAGTKHLIRKGADAGAKDARGANAMEMAMGRGKIADEELFLMLAG